MSRLAIDLNSQRACLLPVWSFNFSSSALPTVFDSLQPACWQPIKFQTKTKASESSFVCLKAPLLTKLKFACGNDIPTLQSRAIPLSSRPSPLRGSGLDTAVWPSSLLRNVYIRSAPFSTGSATAQRGPTAKRPCSLILCVCVTAVFR